MRSKKNNTKSIYKGLKTITNRDTTNIKKSKKKQRRLTQKAGSSSNTSIPPKYNNISQNEFITNSRENPPSYNEATEIKKIEMHIVIIMSIPNDVSLFLLAFCLLSKANTLYSLRTLFSKPISAYFDKLII